MQSYKFSQYFLGKKKKGKRRKENHENLFRDRILVFSVKINTFSFDHTNAKM